MTDPSARGDQPEKDEAQVQQESGAKQESGAQQESGEQSGQSRPAPDFRDPFDYDATAEASLSEPPSEAIPAPGGTGAGPGWDTYSGVGNGPGWGSTPSYPPPSEGGAVFGAPDPNLGRETSAESGAATEAGGYTGTGYGQQPTYGEPGAYGAPQYAQQPFDPQGQYGQQYPYGAQPYMAAPYGYGPVDPAAPYGRHPMTGEPFSDKSKLTAGLLELFLGAFGAGRFYLGQPGIAIAQIAVTWLTCGVGAIWPLIDAVLMLVGNVKDKYGRPLRD